jgi:hypothetical protein
MKRLVSGLSLAAAIAALTACGGNQPNAPASPMYTAGGTYDAYYDNAYGPIYDGYWSNGAFVYRTAPDQPYQQDTAGHFRQQPTPGFQEIQGQVHPGAPGATSAPPGQPPQ